MNKIIDALETILENAKDADVAALDTALRTYPEFSRSLVKGSLLKMIEAMEQECGYRLTCRACDGSGNHSTIKNVPCTICDGSGIVSI